MPELTTIIKAFLSTSVLTGSGMVAMGLGVIDVDPGLEAVARVYLDVLDTATRPFLVFLGTAKVLSVLSLWNMGPMPRKLAYVGLGAPALCAVYGHHVQGETPQTAVALLYAVALGFFVKKETDSVTGFKRA